MDWMFGFPQNSYVEILIPKVVVSERGVVELSWVWLVPL